MIRAESRQSILDIAIQAHGSIEAMVKLGLMNDICITDEIEAGMLLKAVDDVDAKVKKNYAVNGWKPATAITTNDLGNIHPDGIEYWGIEVDFISS